MVPGVWPLSSAKAVKTELLTLKMKSSRSVETLSTRYHIPEDSNVRAYRCENLKHRNDRESSSTFATVQTSSTASPTTITKLKQLKEKVIINNMANSANEAVDCATW
jgi:hypothetical protein